MSRNLPLAFAEVLGGGLVLLAGLSGESLGSVASGGFSLNPFVKLGGGKSVADSIGSVSASIGHGASSKNLFASGTPVSWNRTDQGIDASVPPGTSIHAIESGQVSQIWDFYKGQPALVIDSPGLPGGATGIYYSEQITPSVQVGQSVKAGDTIGTVASSGTGLEFGFSKGSQTLARATTGYVEGQATEAGKLFRQFIGIP